MRGRDPRRGALSECGSDATGMAWKRPPCSRRNCGEVWKPSAKITSVSNEESTSTKMSVLPLVSSGSMLLASDSNVIDSPEAFTASE